MRKQTLLLNWFRISRVTSLQPPPTSAYSVSVCLFSPPEGGSIFQDEGRS